MRRAPISKGISLFRQLVVLTPVIWAIFTAPATATQPFVLLQSTTSTQNSGLLDYVIPKFREKTGIDVRVVAVGTGQALKNARNGDGDLVLVHARQAEDRFLASGFGIDRRDVMYNDFVVVGPEADAAGISGLKDAASAFAKIASARAVFVSRADGSGTHSKERALWQAVEIDPSVASGGWYREAGAGMGATLNIAVAIGAYTLSDRGTWTSFGNRRGLKILVQGDPRLFNPYGLIRVNPARHPHVNAEGAKLFADWLTGSAGQAAIGAFRRNGTVLFHPVGRSQQTK